MGLFRVELFGYRGIIGHIGKQHGHQLTLSLNSTAGVEYFIGQKLGSVRLRMVIIDGWDFIGSTEIMATSIAKSAGRWILLSTFCADDFQTLTTTIAKSSVSRIFSAAFRAFHNFTLNMRLIMKRLDASDIRIIRVQQEA
jgi:hypothetical protein